MTHNVFLAHCRREMQSRIAVLVNRANSFNLTAGLFKRMTLNEQMTRLARQARAASRELAKLTTAEKNACLLAMATALEQNAGALKQANALDMDAAAKSGLSSAMLDRLKLDDKRIAGMARGLREVAALPDPVGKILDERVRPERTQAAKNFHAHRRRGHHLRIAPERDGGRRQPLFQIRQRDDLARRPGGDALKSNHRQNND